AGAAGDLAVSLATVGDRASSLLARTLGLVLDATTDREAIAVGDTAIVTARLFNGGQQPIVVSQLTATRGPWSRAMLTARDTLAPGDTLTGTGGLPVGGGSQPGRIVAR